jgi:carboxypeptidase Q
VKHLFLITVLFTLTNPVFSQAIDKKTDEVQLKKIYDKVLLDSRCYDWLRTLSKEIGHRLSGSAAAEKAVRWSKSTLDTMGLDSVWLQPVLVPHWVRGKAEKVHIVSSMSTSEINLDALALGGSVGTSAKGIVAPVVEVTSWEALDQLGEAGVKGKIVFFNRPMDRTKIRTFEAYGGCVDQRVGGASKAAKYGAVAVLVRSMNLKMDDFPHTGTVRYDSAYAIIPAVAISTNAAEKLSKVLKINELVNVFIKMECETLPDVLSYNVIGEIKGSVSPDKVLLVGGHLDSWDVGEGSHDDGAGVVQSMEVLRLFQKTGIRPRHTIRCVLFMNEENGVRGGKKYAEEAERKHEFHVCSIESDAGGFTPRGFSFDGDASVLPDYFEKVKAFSDLLQPYGLELKKGGSGSDISPLKGMKGLLSGYSPDSQRYFDVHHTAADVFEAVHQRELELGAASMAALIFLVDKYGL